MTEREPTHKAVQSPPPAPGPHKTQHSVRPPGGTGAESYCSDCRRWMFLDQRNHEIDVFGNLVEPETSITVTLELTFADRQLIAAFMGRRADEATIREFAEAELAEAIQRLRELNGIQR